MMWTIRTKADARRESRLAFIGFQRSTRTHKQVHARVACPIAQLLAPARQCRCMHSQWQPRIECSNETGRVQAAIEHNGSHTKREKHSKASPSQARTRRIVLDSDALTAHDQHPSPANAHGEVVNCRMWLHWHHTARRRKKEARESWPGRPVFAHRCRRHSCKEADEKKKKT